MWFIGLLLNIRLGSINLTLSGGIVVRLVTLISLLGLETSLFLTNINVLTSGSGLETRSLHLIKSLLVSEVIASGFLSISLRVFERVVHGD